jgi:hypothetical protein
MLARALMGAGLAGLMLLVAPLAYAAKNPALAEAEAYVAKRCPANTREISTQMWATDLQFNALYGNCRAGDGRDQRIWFFVGGRFLGTDAAKSSHYIIGLWRDDRRIAFLYVLYRQSDPECCPTGGGAIVRFRWTGSRVARLDRLPARAFAPGIEAGR